MPAESPTDRSAETGRVAELDQTAEPTAEPRPPLVGHSRDELRRMLAPWIDRPFRADQVYEAIHRQGVGELGAVTTLSKALRQTLEERFTVGLPRVASRQTSPDGTVKLLLELADGAGIEAVDIPEGDRRTLCLSSQAGCALGCTFCVTGYWGAGRDLTPGEIVAQYLVIRRHWESEPLRVNLVFMGMGEPLLNLGAVKRALAILSESVPWRRITVSTAGIVGGIEEMARWPRRPNLAVSLHAPDDARRSRVMPVNRSHPLPELLAALRRFPLEKGRRLTFEYILIDGFNDRLEDADAVARLLSGLRAKVNLIPINPDPVLGEAMVPPPEAVVDAFQKRLRRRGLTATVRRRRGDPVSAACGQLRAFAREPRGVLARRSQSPQRDGTV
jgi:23S rRNA (adenine2503-C2)-methyltransferase